MRRPVGGRLERERRRAGREEGGGDHEPALRRRRVGPERRVLVPVCVGPHVERTDAPPLGELACLTQIAKVVLEGPVRAADRNRTGVPAQRCP